MLKSLFKMFKRKERVKPSLKSSDIISVKWAQVTSGKIVLKHINMLKFNSVLKGEWVKITIHIKEVSTGEVRIFENKKSLLFESSFSDYYWSEGNFGCDCNRIGMFTGKQYVSELPCSDDKYLLNIINPINGQILYKEF